MAGWGSGSLQRAVRATAAAGRPAAAAVQLGGIQVTLRCAENASTIFMRALVVLDSLEAVLVGIGQSRLHIGRILLVVSRPGLVASQVLHPVEDRRAVLALALVGVDLGEVDLGEAR